MHHHGGACLNVISGDYQTTLRVAWYFNDEEAIGRLNEMPSFIQYNPMQIEIGSLVYNSIAMSTMSSPHTHASLMGALVLIRTESYLSDIIKAGGLLWWLLPWAWETVSLASIVIGSHTCLVLADYASISVCITHRIMTIAACLDNPGDSFSVLGSHGIFSFCLLLHINCIDIILSGVISCCWDLLCLVIVEVVIQQISPFKIAIFILILTRIVTNLRKEIWCRHLGLIIRLLIFLLLVLVILQLLLLARLHFPEFWVSLVHSGCLMSSHDECFIV